MKKDNININISQDTNKKESAFLHIYKLLFEKIAQAKWSKILKVYFVSFFFLISALVCYFGFRAASDEEIVKNTALKLAAKEQNEDNIREYAVTPRIQHDLGVLTYTINADRAFLFELHNGKKNTSGLPFRFADMTYEEVNENRKVDKVAMEFQDIPLTLYKYPHYLQKQKMIMGTVDEIEKIDSDFAGHIREIGGVYLGMIYITNRGIPLGFLCVSYHNMEDVPDKEVIKNKLIEYDKSLTQLLDLQMQITSIQ